MMMKPTILAAALAFACSMGVATAQQPEQLPVSPDQLKKLIPSQGVAQGPGVPSSGGGATLAAPGNVALGWNYFHATYCEWYSDGTNNYIYVFPSEGGYWYYLNNDYVTKTFLTGRVNGYYEPYML